MERSFPLENTLYSAEDAQLWMSTRTTGVYAQEDNLRVEAAAGMNIRVTPGIAWLSWARFKGVIYGNTEPITRALALSGGTQARIDRVVVRYDIVLNTVTMQIKQGAYAAANPAAPAIRRDAAAFEIALADIYIAQGAVSITQSDITDRRGDHELCGLMNDGINSASQALEPFKQEVAGMINNIKAPPPWDTFGPVSLCPYNNRAEITTSRSWVCPAGVTVLDAFLVGGGGGGQGGAAGAGGYGGGGGYTLFRKRISVTPGQSYQITIGAGGAGGISYNTPGGTGGSTTAFGHTVNGGGGGAALPGGGGAGGSGGGGASSGTGGSDGKPGDNGRVSGTLGGVGGGVSTRDPYTGKFYAGGGGGGDYTGGQGGAGGGGQGGGAGDGGAGTVNTGGGAGGGGAGAVNTGGGSGGSGIVIIYY